MGRLSLGQPSAKWSESDRKFVLEKGACFDSALLPLIQNLIASGLTESDIGILVGYQGESTEKWLSNLKSHNPDVRKAYDAGKQMADCHLVAQMFRSAIGYDYEEIEEQYEGKPDLHDPTQIRYIKTGIVRKIRHKPGNAALAMFMAENRMPESFKRKLEFTKRDMNLNLSGEVSAEQIDRLLGKLGVKQIESKEVTNGRDNPIIDSTKVGPEPIPDTKPES